MDTGENKSIPFTHPSHSCQLPKTVPMLFFLLYPFFQELTQNCDAHAGQMFSLLLFHSFFTSESLFFTLSHPEQTHFLVKYAWKTEVCIFCCPLSFYLILNDCFSSVEQLLPRLLGCLTFILLLVQVLEKGLHCHRLGLQVHDLEQHIKLMLRLTTLQDQENKRMQKWVKITRLKQFFVLLSWRQHTFLQSVLTM